jgi:hypothetical protein
VEHAPRENNDDGDIVEQAEMPNEQAIKKNKLHLPLNKVTRSYATNISTQNTNEDGMNLHQPARKGSQKQQANNMQIMGGTKSKNLKK